MTVQAVEAKTRVSFAEYEAKLVQQQQALARDHQKGVATMQSRINSLQAQLASDAAQHTAAVKELQQHISALQHHKELASAKCEHLLQHTFAL